MEPVIQHWLVAVARAASLEGADHLTVPADTEIGSAWDLVAMATGTDSSGLAELIGSHFGLGVADLTSTDPHALRLLPGRVARKLSVLPLRQSDSYVWVATADPLSFEAEKEICHVAGRAVHFEVAPPSELGTTVSAAYGDDAGTWELPPLEPMARGGPRALVVDDDTGTRLLLRSFLEQAGFRVTEAVDGDDAIARLEDQEGDPLSVVTLDLAMPGTPGLDVLRHIRSHSSTRHLPVIVATGLDDPDTEIDLFQAGADDYVVKPVDPRRFLVRVEAVLRRLDPEFSIPT